MIVVYLTIHFLLLHVTLSKQSYDPNPCSAHISPASHYTCNSYQNSCKTYVVYRSQEGFNTLEKISAVFGVNQDQLLRDNNLTSSSKTLEKDREVLIHVQCYCLSNFFRSNVSYLVPEGTTSEEISCSFFESLVKPNTLAEENQLNATNIKVGEKLTVPLSCACVDLADTTYGFKYLVTYPFVQSDSVSLVAQKFGIPLSDILAENSIDPEITVYSKTTILVPLLVTPLINSSIIDPNNSDHDFIPMHPTKLIDGDQSQKILYVIASVIGILFLLLAFLGFGLFSYKWRHSNLNSFTTRRSTASCLSPDLVAGLKKYSLINYSFDELSNATKCFSEETKLGSSVNKGILGENPFAVKRMSFSNAQRTISVYSQINHTNIINLEGVCHGGKELSSSYLVFESARNDNLRDCLNNLLDTLPWHKRSQIALDVAEGLHYIHHCTVPSYIHLNISSRNILITNEWRAKIANLGTSSAVSFAICDEWITPEYINGDPISPKVDVFAFGVVLLELLTAKEARDGSLLREKLSILSEKGRTNGCLQELNELMDQSLRVCHWRSSLHGFGSQGMCRGRAITPANNA